MTLKKVQLLNILRWITMAPGAIIAYLFAYYALAYVNQQMIAEYANTDSWYIYAIIIFMSSFGSGAAFVYAAWYIAPSYKRNVAIVFTAITIFITGACTALNILSQSYENLLACIFIGMGAILTCYEVIKKK